MTIRYALTVFVTYHSVGYKLYHNHLTIPFLSKYYAVGLGVISVSVVRFVGFKF